VRERGGSLTLAAVLVLAVAPSAARAEPHTLESVGAVGVHEGDRRDPKQRAVQAALQEAVWRVAEDLLVDTLLLESLEGDEETAAEEPDLARVLGDDMVVYTTRFKVIEDRGLGPALFIDDPEIAAEYVVVAEVVVEPQRIRERLVRAGLLSTEVTEIPTGTVHLEVEGLSVYPALSDLRLLLTDTIGAQSALPVRLERGRAVLAVGTPLAGEALVAELERTTPENLAIVPLAVSSDQARIAVRWTPRIEESPADRASAPADTEIPAWARP